MISQHWFRCLTAPSHYLSQSWPRSLSPYGVTRPQWVNLKMNASPYIYDIVNVIVQYFWILLVLDITHTIVNVLYVHICLVNSPIWIHRCCMYVTNMLLHVTVFHWSLIYPELTHWGRDKMTAIYQTILSNAFSWMKMYELRLQFHWILSPRVQLTIFQHWFI